MKINYLKLIGSIAISNLAGFLGSLSTISSIPTWYAGLQKPSFNPPNWVFGPVWTMLYTLMGISFYLIWTSKSKLKNTAMIIFGIQLLLNAIWSPLFFGLKNPLLAFIDIILMWISIVATIIIFYKIKPMAAYLLIPYILWVSFAALLNFSLWQLNI